MPAGVAFDGSPWVTAASSVGLGACERLFGVSNCMDNLSFTIRPVFVTTVVVSLGMTVAGGVLFAKRLADEDVRFKGRVLIMIV